MPSEHIDEHTPDRNANSFKDRYSFQDECEKCFLLEVDRTGKRKLRNFRLIRTIKMYKHIQ